MSSIQKTILLLTFVAGVWGCHSSWAQQTARYTTHNESFKVGYLEYLPPGYLTTTDRFPVIIYLHGGGEGGEGTPESLEKVKSWGPPGLIQGGVDMCFTVNDTKDCFIVLSPQKPDNYSWSYIVYNLIENMLHGPDAYRIDPDRIYLTGLSRGGMGAYEFAGSTFNKPNKLAAIAPMSAWLENGEGCTIADRKINVWAFHGRKDTIVPYSLGLRAFSSVEGCLPFESDVETKFTTYEDRYHDAWIPGYSSTHAYQAPNVYEWLLMQKRAAPDPAPITNVNEGPPGSNSFSVYPNPSHEQIIVSFDGASSPEAILSIRSIAGSLSRLIVNPAVPIDISDLPRGIYLLQLEDRKGMIATQRLIKK